MLWKYSLKTYKGNFVALFPKIEVINIARIVNAVQYCSVILYCQVTMIVMF